MRVPRILLKDEATLYGYTGETDRYGKPVYSEEQTLTNVRIEKVDSLKLDSLGYTGDVKAIMYYALGVSEPSGIIFLKDDKIVFDGSEFTVKEVEKFESIYERIYLS